MVLLIIVIVLLVDVIATHPAQPAGGRRSIRLHDRYVRPAVARESHAATPRFLVATLRRRYILGRRHRTELRALAALGSGTAG